ncbi:MAG TPA: lysozyme inhibitor LprI family protein [Rhizomicrobium sp.]|jgi:uncharacterized protein YecT (DUF1311 family)|nr:lysozyme inhibitor LprI family protein [Rhizomicrobium sp.]
MKTFAIALLALGACALAPLHAFADDAIDCNSNSLSQADQDDCAGRDYKKSDAALNAIYKTMMSKYDVANGALLKTSEKTWLAYRDAQCDYETNGSVGGTMNPMLVTICKTRMADERVKLLNAQMKCEDGDLSCNKP